MQNAASTASLRRSVSASNASRSSCSRSIATARSDASAGTIRATTAASAGPGAGVERVPILRRNRPRAGSRTRQAASSAPRRGRSTRARRRARLRRARREAVELVGHGSPAEQGRGDGRKERRLSLALLGSVGALPRSCREPTGHHRHDEIERECEPVLALSEVERMCRREEEPVERKHARDRYGKGIGETPYDRDRQHREDVQGAETSNGSPAVEDADQHRDERDGTGACEDPDDDVAAGVPDRAAGEHRASVAGLPSAAARVDQPTSPASEALGFEWSRGGSNP